MAQQHKKERWSSQMGAILAVTGSAVGLANFLRFPGQAAQYGGGAFMLAYFLALLIVALPIAWAEWTMGRHGGQHGFSACPGILNYICKHPLAKYLGILGVLVPLIIYMYYAYVEAWCLGYAMNFITGKISFSNVEESGSFWVTFIGASEDGSAVGFGFQQVGFYLLIAFLLNFTLVYRGITKGIEIFCKFAVPTLIIIALVVLIRVLTLGAPNPDKPENNVINGLGYMWNPTKVAFEEWSPVQNKWQKVDELLGKETIAKHTEIAKANPDQFRVRQITIWDQLKRPQLWLAAASQIFFSLSAGLGLIITYASYMKKDDDVVLSSLCASSANEFCEVGIGGLMSIPAAFIFLGASGLAGMTTFALGFKALPMVFSQMPLGNLFGFLFFILLFLAAVNGSISCLQPSIAFFEETLHIGRRRSVAILGMITALGCGFVVWFSEGARALDTFDFWVGNFLVFVIATIQIIIFGWVFGLDNGLKEAHRGAAIRIPKFFNGIIKYLCPFFLLTIFGFWLFVDVLGLGSQPIDSHVLDLIGSDTHPVSLVSWVCVGLIISLFFFLSLIAARAPAYKLSTKEKS